METLSISKSNLSSILASLSLEDKTWAIKFLADTIITDASSKVTIPQSAVSHAWKDYTISKEVMGMTMKRRKEVSRNYKSELTDLLEEKYK